MKGAVLFGAAAMIAFCLPETGEAVSTVKIVAEVQRKYAALNDFSAEFEQESMVATLGRSRFRRGTILFKRPGRMRWDYDDPDPQLIVTDGSTLWFYRPVRKQVVVRELRSAFTSQTPLLFLFDQGEGLSDEFTWEEKDLSPGGDGRYVLELRPRQETPDLIALTLEVIQEDFSIGAMVLRDAFGNVTRLDFSGEKENQGLDEGLFTFEPPRGTEVVRP